MRLILASTSPRRREILALLQVPFEVAAPEFEEVLSPTASIKEEVLAFAYGKAKSVLLGFPGAVIIGSDTMIALEGLKIGKPADIDDARRTLAALSGKRHTIYTSVVILDDAGGPGLQMIESVEVEMHRLTRGNIDKYLSEGESLDKAGAYSIQGRGRELIQSIQGDYLAAVGLPLRPIAEYLANQGMAHADVEPLYDGKNFLNRRSLES